tara:strand:+ start:114 stop:281 length:168 start_codon:yes stop_codon:yes gene_type:complete
VLKTVEQKNLIRRVDHDISARRLIDRWVIGKSKGKTLSGVWVVLLNIARSAYLGE